MSTLCHSAKVSRPLFSPSFSAVSCLVLGLMSERLSICGELWKQGLSADLMYDEAVHMSLEEIVGESLGQVSPYL